ncbi:MAG: hypothetical protein ACLQIB_29135 [Isosphaeraceae bacterium]
MNLDLKTPVIIRDATRALIEQKKDPAAAPSEVDAIRHKEKRKNIPTEELRDFVAADEAEPAKMLYPRDPSLDPQLVWKGKDEQDRQPLEVDVVPIYIQEVIEPSVIIDAIEARKTTKPDNSGHELAKTGRIPIP